MKTLTTLEKRLKRAHEFRQSTFTRPENLYLLPIARDCGAKPVVADLPESEAGKIKRFITELWTPIVDKNDPERNQTIRLIRFKQSIFVLALAAILLIILNG